MQTIIDMKLTQTILFNLLFILCIAVSVSASDTNYNPIADPAAVVVSGNMRFTILTPEIIRMEWSTSRSFEDRASFIAVNRKLPVPQYTAEEKDGYLHIRTEKLDLRYKLNSYPKTSPLSSSNLRIAFEMDGKEVVWYPDKSNPHNLKGTTRTLDNANGNAKLGDMEDGVLSRAGWVLLDEKTPNNDGSYSLLFNDDKDMPWVETRNDNSDSRAFDWYFMAYGHDYKRALGDYVKIAGRIAMPPLFAFGYWYSKFQDYTEAEFKDIVNEFYQHDIPIDVMVVDMGWHTGDWTGWSWNKRLIPNPEKFMEWMHERDLKVTLNLHPAEGVAPNEDNFNALANELNLPLDKTVEWNIENKDFYKAFFKNILRPHEDIGVDFWWLDWQQWLLARNVDKLGNTFWLNHVFFNDMKNNRPDRRPLIFHRWGGMGNHRYPIGFSGDTWSNFPSLAFQPYFTATASNVGYGYWSHDIGGHHQGSKDGELYLRWIQFGVFSPVLRTHAITSDEMERRIWMYPEFTWMKEAFELRYAMAPYIYTYARYAYDTGISLCRPMYYDYPESDEAYQYQHQYMFGNEILVAPVVERKPDRSTYSEVELWLPEGKWYEAETYELLDGNKVVSRNFTLGQIPYYYKAGAVIPHYPRMTRLKTRPDKLILQFVPGAAGEFRFYEDENDNDKYRDGAYTFTKITQQTENNTSTYIIYPSEGSFDGMPEARSYELRLLLKQPEEVKVNGIVYPFGNDGREGTWSFDQNKKHGIIYIPQHSCAETIEVLVEFESLYTAVDSYTGNTPHTIFYDAERELLNINLGALSDNMEVSLYNTKGEMLVSESYRNCKSIRKDLSPYQLPLGLYICRISCDRGTYSHKLYKTK